MAKTGADTSPNNRVLRAGDTMTGNLHINPTSGDGRLYIQRPAGTDAAWVEFDTGGTGNQWLFGLDNNSTGFTISYWNGASLISPILMDTSGNVALIAKLTSNAPTGGIGYSAGAGGAVVQATNKSTGVTLNTICGTVTMNGAALAASTTVTFVLTDSAIAATDVLILNHSSVGTAGSYTLNAQAAAGSASINVRNVSLGSLSEAIVIRFAVIKAVVA